MNSDEEHEEENDSGEGMEEEIGEQNSYGVPDDDDDALDVDE